MPIMWHSSDVASGFRSDNLFLRLLALKMQIFRKLFVSFSTCGVTYIAEAV